MNEVDIRVSFRGDMADQHSLPAYEAAQSIEGITRSLVLIGNYLAEGKVRKKYPYSERLVLEWKAIQPGSFETLIGMGLEYEHIAEWLKTLGIFVAGGVATGTSKVISDFVSDTIKRTLKKRVGQAYTAETPQLQELENKKSGDLDAVMDAILPSAKKSHTVVGQGATNILVIYGDNNIVKFDGSTKEYLKSPRMERDLRTKLVSVGSFNVNTQYGRVYDFELGRTIAFIIDREASSRTMEKLGLSLAKYSGDRDAGKINIQYHLKTDLAGQPELYIITDAWFDTDPRPNQFFDDEADDF
jgi:hypothetical protein